MRIWRGLSQWIPGKYPLFNQKNSILLSARDISITLCVWRKSKKKKKEESQTYWTNYSELSFAR